MTDRTPDPTDGHWSNGDPVHVITDGENRRVAPNHNGATWVPGGASHSDTYTPTDPRVTHAIEQLARYNADLDRHRHGSSGWDQLPITGQEEYRKDATIAVHALVALGWVAAPTPEFGTRNTASSQGRAGRADEFVLVHDDFFQAKRFADQDPNEQLIYRRPAIPAGPWITPKGPETNG